MNLGPLLFYVEATVTDFLPITPSPAKSPSPYHHPRAHNAQGKQSTSVCCHDCRDARVYAAQRDEEHRRSSKSRWPAGERNRSGGLFQHFSHIQPSPLSMACASAGLYGAYVRTSHLCYSFIIHMNISLHADATSAALQVCRLHPFDIKQVYQVRQFTVPPILTSQSPYFFHPLLSIQLSPPTRPSLISPSLIQNVAFVIG